MNAEKRPVYPFDTKMLELRQLDIVPKNPVEGKSQIFPDFCCRRVADIDFEWLHHMGVRKIVFDVDGTLVDVGKDKVNQEDGDAVYRAKEKGLVEEVYFGSNVNHEFASLAPEWDAKIISPTLFRRKPFQRYFRHLIEEILTCQPYEAAMVGDKIIDDIKSANAVGMVTILVDSRGLGVGDHFRLLPWREKRLRGLLPPLL